MFKLVRNMATDQAARILSHPKLAKIMSDPRVVSAVARGLELQNQLFMRMEESFKLVGEILLQIPRKKEEEHHDSRPGR